MSPNGLPVLHATGRRLRVALVADPLTHVCLQPECDWVDLTPANHRQVLQNFQPDFVFFESVWHGPENAWTRKVASYPWYRFTSNRAVRQLTQSARELGIPTVFWCKEDSVHFDRFINSARHFDHVLTVDANCVPRYRAVMGPQASVGVLLFPVQPRLHSFTGFDFRHRRALFMGSYSRHIHNARRAWQDMAFEAATRSGLGLTVYDRNSGRKSSVYRYPQWPGLEVWPMLGHGETAGAYKAYVASLNVNTVTDSPSMYSRRLVEILACGGIAVTSPAPSVDLLFKDFCHIINSPQEALPLFERLAREGPRADDLARARAGAEYVAREMTWGRRLADVAALLKLNVA